MISRYDVTLNNVRMADLDERLLILDVSYDQPKVQMETVPIAGKDGLVISRKHKETASVTISFELHIYGTADRQDVLQSVIQWAKDGGVLKTNDREGQRLVCVCDKFPSINSVKSWTAPLSITFTAYQTPYWESDEPATLVLSGTDVSDQMEVPGNGGDAFVSCTIVSGGSLSSIRVSAEDSFIELSNLSVPIDGEIEIAYNSGVLSIMYEGASLLSKRTSESSDDLTVRSGYESTFSVLADASVQATFSVRGCWM